MYKYSNRQANVQLGSLKRVSTLPSKKVVISIIIFYNVIVTCVKILNYYHAFHAVLQYNLTSQLVYGSYSLTSQLVYGSYSLTSQLVYGSYSLTSQLVYGSYSLTI